ncbi:MAG: hypothetical protein SWY16_19625 [Cyanobacteriota bacterium]|nr:hypothetical protein [Cyanobacteriota bacterium]
MKGRNSKQFNLDRLRAANSLNKSNQELRSSLNPSAKSRRSGCKIEFVVSGLTIALMMFGWLEWSDRQPSIPHCHQQPIQFLERDMV